MPRNAPKSILVVDDDPDVLRLLSSILSTAGYRVLEASDGKQAVARFTEEPADLLITDLIMPEQEGVQTITTLMHNYPRLKTIAISGAARGKYLKIAGMLGAHAVLQKPFHKQDLLDTVRKLLS
jgi:CheY-like chemotaxis protein